MDTGDLLIEAWRGPRRRSKLERYCQALEVAARSTTNESLAHDLRELREHIVKNRLKWATNIG